MPTADLVADPQDAGDGYDPMTVAQQVVQILPDAFHRYRVARRLSTNST